MALVEIGASPETRERRFFVIMAFVFAATIIAGFGSWSLRGMVVYPVPPLVHLHGAIFLSWLALFITQTSLMQQRATKLHRRVGWFSLLLASAMVVIGTLTALESVALKRVPPFFPEGIFLALSFIELFCFAALVIAAIAMRRRTDWHRRLMLGSMFMLMGPAWGRVLPMMALGPFGGLVIMAILLVGYLGVAVCFDLYNRGRLHPAYAIVALAIIIEGVAPGPVGMTPPFIKLAAMLKPL